jgi:hypothetical protein
VGWVILSILSAAFPGLLICILLRLIMPLNGRGGSGAF